MLPKYILAFAVCWLCLAEARSPKHEPQEKETSPEMDAPKKSLETSGKIYRLPSGGSSLESLKRIKEMMKVRRQNIQNTNPGSRGSLGGIGSFPFTKFGPQASNQYNFGHLNKKRPYRTSHPGPSYGSAGGSSGGSSGGSHGSGSHGGSSHGGSSHGGSSGSGSYSEPTTSYEPDLTITDYKNIWVQMLQEIYKIIKDKSLLQDSSFGTKVLDHLFYLLQDIRILHSYQSNAVPCPDIYHRSGDLCLSVDFIDSFLDFYEARLYCQMVKGGDLVMFRDANEFHDIVNFINSVDVKNENSYWLGLSDKEGDNDWRFIDGRNVHFKSPFWGVRLNPASAPRPTSIAPFGNQGNYAFFNKDDFYYLHNAGTELAEEQKVLPLCQYIPERDQQNFQYGEGVWESWNEYNEWSGWNDQDTIHTGPPHSNYAGPNYFGQGFGPLHHGYHTNHRSNAPRKPRVSGMTGLSADAEVQGLQKTEE